MPCKSCFPSFESLWERKHGSEAQSGSEDTLKWGGGPGVLSPVLGNLGQSDFKGPRSPHSSEPIRGRRHPPEGKRTRLAFLPPALWSVVSLLTALELSALLAFQDERSEVWPRCWQPHHTPDPLFHLGSTCRCSCHGDLAAVLAVPQFCPAALRPPPLMKGQPTCWRQALTPGESS